MDTLYSIEETMKLRKKDITNEIEGYKLIKEAKSTRSRKSERNINVVKNLWAAFICKLFAAINYRKTAGTPNSTNWINPC